MSIGTLYRPNPAAQPRFHYMHNIVDAWLGKLEQARKSKKGFQSVADMCESFYSADTDFM